MIQKHKTDIARISEKLECESSSSNTEQPKKDDRIHDGV